jgi:hypothetical protein
MAIPEAQLETWSKQGSVTQSKATYATIKAALETVDAPYAAKDYSVFLQGSYGNDTNIYADSDVDVVMRTGSVYYHNLDELSETEKAAFNQARSAATYDIDDFKRDVTTQLTKKFGSSVTVGTKAIFIKGNGGRRDADVVPCAEFRYYRKFNSQYNQQYEEGICFFLKDGTQIVNYPKQHAAHCTSKQQSTNSFKPTVRAYNNFRNKMIESGLIEEGLAPSYYLESLLYNVPVDRFGGGHVANFTDTLNWLLAADRSKFLCANQMFYLFHDYSPVTWRAAKCDKFLTAAVNLWDSWH